MPDPSTTPVEDAVAAMALRRHALSFAATATLINRSENATYVVEDPPGRPVGALRVHREGYQSAAAIASELDWLTAVGAETGIVTAPVMPARDGSRVVTVEGRHTVLFEWLPGAAPEHAALTAEGFEALGALTARLHRHARAWARPPGFTRFAWDWPHALGDAARWGRWTDGVGVGPGERAVLGAAAELARSRLTAYGTAPERFGLVHADLRTANLLVDGDRTAVIDFDDCGFSWFVYDFAAAVSFLEHDPRLPQWREGWLRGYRTVASLAVEDEAMLATTVIVRRLMLVAWMGTHPHAQEARELGAEYTAASCVLAERYLASAGRSVSA